MSKQKILFILDHLKGGGAERIALELCEELQDRGFEVRVILLDGSDIKMQIPNGISIDNLDVNQKFLLGKLWRSRENRFLPDERSRLQEKVRVYQPDAIVLSHWYAYCVYPAIKDLGRIFFWVHGEIFQPERQKTTNLFRFYKEYRRWYLDNKYFKQKLDGKNLIVVNDDLRLRYQGSIPNANIVVLPNGINATKIIEQLSNLPHHSKNKQWDCVFVGRLSAEKQPEHAIEAFAKSGITGRMAIVGNGRLEDNLIKLCHTLGVADRVDFLGWQTNPYLFIKQSKCLILSSNTEGSPLVIAESLLLDVPVVAYDINGGIRQQLDYDSLKRGLVENQNLDMLAKTLSNVVKNPYIISDEDKQRLSMQKMAESFIDKVF